MSADLTYYIFEGLLTGIVGGRMIHMIALSGGGGGSTLHKTVMSMNNPYMEALKTVGSGKTHVHGGPLPPGQYHIEKSAKHRHLGLSARLDPPAGHSPMGRDGFYLHGAGPHGSDGLHCAGRQRSIPVVDGPSHEIRRNLLVVETMDLSRFA